MDDDHPPHDNDGELAIRLMLGEEDAFGEFIERHGPRVKGHLDAKCGSRTDLADEAFNIALAKVWNKAGVYDESKGPLGAWFLRIAVNTLIDLARKEKRHRHKQIKEDSLIEEAKASDAEELSPKAAKAAERKRRDNQAAIRQVVESLPPQQQAIVWADTAHPDGQVPVAELAERLGTSENAIKAARSKARATLKKELARRGLNPAS